MWFILLGVAIIVAFVLLPMKYWIVFYVSVFVGAGVIVGMISLAKLLYRLFKPHATGKGKTRHS